LFVNRVFLEANSALLLYTEVCVLDLVHRDDVRALQEEEEDLTPDHHPDLAVDLLAAATQSLAADQCLPRTVAELLIRRKIVVAVVEVLRKMALEVLDEEEVSDAVTDHAVTVEVVKMKASR